MNMTMEMSLLPQPQVHSSKECIEQSELHPDDFNMDENSPCNYFQYSTGRKTRR